MPVSPSKARSLCTAAEYELVKASTPKAIKDLSPSQLKGKVDRARKLRDKNRDLAKRQRGEARGKRKPTSARPAKGNDNTVLKAQLFDEALTRFQKALEKADAAPVTKKAKATSSSPKSKASAHKRTSKPKKTSSAKESKPPAKPIPLAGGGPVRRLGGSLSLGASGSGGSLSDVFGSSLAAQQSRETRRKEKSASTKIGREQSHFARTSQEKIQGHVSSATRRSQAKRDSKGS